MKYQPLLVLGSLVSSSMVYAFPNHVENPGLTSHPSRLVDRNNNRRVSALRDALAEHELLSLSARRGLDSQLPSNLLQRSPLAVPVRMSAPPTKNQPPKHDDKAKQDQANKDGVTRVNKEQQDQKDAAAKDITSAHTSATSEIDQANAGEKEGLAKLKAAEDYAKAHPGDRRAQNGLRSAQRLLASYNENGEWKKKYAAYKEQQKDGKALSGFAQQSTDTMNLEFNKDGNAKSDHQKAMEKAKAGFLKFLQIFAEVVGDLTMFFPGLGEVLQVGIRLEQASVEIATKVGKIGTKSVKFADKVREALDIKSGPQVIQGVAGKEMDQLQKKLIGELIDMASNNQAATAKKLADTKLKGYKEPQVHLRGPRKQQRSIQN